MKLVYEKSGIEVKKGDTVMLKGGEEAVVSYFAKPHKAASSGKVSVSYRGCDLQMEYFVGIIGAKWIEREDQGWKPVIRNPPLKRIEDRLMTLLRERDYEPKIARGPDRFWVITFTYDGTKVWNISPDSLMSEQWWLV